MRLIFLSRLIPTAVCFLFVTTLHAQTRIDEALNRQFSVLGSGAPAQLKKQASDSVQTMLLSFLSEPASFNQTPQVNHLGKITSEDEKLNIYSWNYQNPDHTFSYGCIIQHKTEEAPLQVIPLADTRNDIPENKTLKPGEWYGCLYYSVIVKTKRKKTYYTLLGWDGHNSITARKIIDVLVFRSNGEPVFGTSVFKMKTGTQKRVVFEFAASGSMVLVYDPDYKRIIFDHLSPASPELEGQSQYYGSDFTYDGFRFKRGKWFFEEMLDPRNKSN